MAENASLFLCYNQIQALIRTTNGMQSGQPLSLGQLAIAAGGAGAVASFLLYVHVDSTIFITDELLLPSLSLLFLSVQNSDRISQV
jgi:hypothetical protein